MDHKVSKDMISSGMIPSGEKSQADLGRTQYGSAPSPSSLFDAYKSMYEKKEEVINEHHKKDADGNTIPHEGEELNEGKMPEGLKKYLEKKNAKKEDKKEMKEENLDEFVFTGAALAGAAKGAAALLSKKAVASAALKLGSKTAAKTVLKKGVAGAAKKGAMAAGKSMVKNPLNTMVGASMLKPGPKMPSAPVNAVQQTKLGRRTAGMYNDVDLFDIVKGQLLDEGLTENEVLDVMTTLTIDEINEVINVEESLAKLALKTGAIATGGYLAKKGLDKAKQSVDNQINKARDKGIGGNTRPGADKMYFGK